ncbi:3-oxoacyl-[acyl-carrier-protein] reductase [Sphingomonas oligophenolica]|uniref:SDR family oxidoreductase n=1 Tax=Sphingomonas oligophenolica TaxID=301154 RepID=A0ABU9YBD8_9SPHN
MAERRNAAIIGATGLVGRGIARALHGAGWAVTAIGRDEIKLAALREELEGQARIIVGSVADDETAQRTASDVAALSGTFDAVITTINRPVSSQPALDMPGETLIDFFRENVATHHCAAKAFIPLLSKGGRYLGIGGGMADFTVPGLVGVSMSQAAQRNLFRFLAQESEERGVSVIELMLYSHIVDPADEAVADPRGIRANEVGAHVLAILQRPDEFTGPILTLKSRKQVGMAERSQ